MKKFEREHRYLVLKISDINEICTEEIKGKLEEIANMVERGRSYMGKPPLTCVVVEADWPEYEPTWRAIEQRVTSAPQSEQTHVLVPKNIIYGEILPSGRQSVHIMFISPEDRDAWLRAATGKESE